MQFETLSLLLSAAGLLLGVGWLFAGRLLLKRWRCEPNAVALIVGRRLGLVYLSVSVVFFAMRATTSTDVIHALSLFACAGNGLLAGMGLIEFFRRNLGPGIWVSIAAECGFLLGFGGLLV